MTTRIDMAHQARGPRATAWRRTNEGESTTRTSRSDSTLRSSASQVPWSSIVSPTASGVGPRSRFSPLRWIARTTKSPLSVIIPGNIFSPTRSDRGGMTTSTTPIWRSMSFPPVFPGRCTRRLSSAKRWMMSVAPLTVITKPAPIGELADRATPRSPWTPTRSRSGNASRSIEEGVSPTSGETSWTSSRATHSPSEY